MATGKRTADVMLTGLLALGWGRSKRDDDQLPRLPLPSEVIQHGVWLYLRFTLSFRDVEDLLAERGVIVSYETNRRWADHFGPLIAADLRRRRCRRRDPRRARSGQVT